MFSNSVLCTWPGYKRTPPWDGICPSAGNGTQDLARSRLMLKRQALPSPSTEAVEDKFLYDLLTETKGSFCVPLLFYLTILFYFILLSPLPNHPILNNRVLPTLLSSLPRCECGFHSVAKLNLPSSSLNLPSCWLILKAPRVIRSGWSLAKSSSDPPLQTGYKGLHSALFTPFLPLSHPDMIWERACLFQGAQCAFLFWMDVPQCQEQ